MPFLSKLLTDTEGRYSTTDKEGLAVVKAVKKFHYYLDGNQFTLYTDHSALVHLFDGKLSENPRIARWSLFLQAYDFKVHHRAGKTNVEADWLSRDVLVVNVESERCTSEPYYDQT